MSETLNREKVQAIADLIARRFGGVYTSKAALWDTALHIYDEHIAALADAQREIERLRADNEMLRKLVDYPLTPTGSKALEQAEAQVRVLRDELWAAQTNADESMQAASEAWARCFELVEMIEGHRPADQKMIQSLKEHKAHVVECRRGSCEHEYIALVRAGLVTPLATPPAPTEATGHE